VRFLQESKSQSIETPYLHSHEQQKLEMEMDSDHMTERSSSLTAIAQCQQEKGKYSVFTLDVCRAFSLEFYSFRWKSRRVCVILIIVLI